MYICERSRSVGAGSATTRKTRGLTRSTIRLIVPPLPAVSRPSKTMQILAPERLTHSWTATSSPCKARELALVGLALHPLRVAHQARPPRGERPGSTAAARRRRGRRDPAAQQPLARLDGQREQRGEPEADAPLPAGERLGEQAALQPGKLGRQDEHHEREERDQQRLEHRRARARSPARGGWSAR